MSFIVLYTVFSSVFSYIVEISPFQKTNTTQISVNGSDIFVHDNCKRTFSLDSLLRLPTTSQSQKESNEPFTSLPIFKGSIKPNEELTWDNYCFKNNTVTLEFEEDKGYKLTIDAQSPKNWYCQDWYVLMTSEDMSFNIINSKGTHVIKRRKWESDEERQEAQANGIRIFTFEGKLLPTMKNIYKLVTFISQLLRSNEKKLIAFTKNTLNYQFIPRTDTSIVPVEEYIQSGDLLGLHKLDPLAQLHWYATGSHLSHIAIALRENVSVDDANPSPHALNQLPPALTNTNKHPRLHSASHALNESTKTESHVFVYETTSNDFFPGPATPWGRGFRRTLFSEWVRAYAQHGYSVVWMKAADAVRRRVREGQEKAIDWFFANTRALTNVSLPYQHIDDLANNLPEGFTPEAFILSLLFLERKKDYEQVINRLFVKGLSMRLYQKYRAGPCTSVGDCLNAVAALGVDIVDVMNTEEDSRWLYDTGAAHNPASLVATMLKEAGAFTSESAEDHVTAQMKFTSAKKQKEGALWKNAYTKRHTAREKDTALDFNPHEMTISNIAMLKMYNTSLPSACITPTTSAIPPFCQLCGKYVIDIPDFNTIPPHTHMFTTCRSKGPEWTPYPDGC